MESMNLFEVLDQSTKMLGIKPGTTIGGLVNTRKLSSVVLTVICLITMLFAERGEAASSPVYSAPTNFVFGTLKKVSDYTLANVDLIGINAWYWDDARNKWLGYSGVSGYNDSGIVFDNMQEIVAIITPEITNQFRNFIGDSSVPNKTNGLMFYARGQIQIPGTVKTSQDLISPIGKFFRVSPHWVNGIPIVPDVSGLQMNISTNVPYFIPGLNWLRLEYGDNGGSTRIINQGQAGHSVAFPGDGYMYLPDFLITNSSTTTGSKWMKLTLSGTNFFAVYNGDGNKVPETPIRLSLIKNQTARRMTNVTYYCTNTLSVCGGDVGRAYVMQMATNSPSPRWFSCSATNYISENATKFTVVASNQFMLFRAATVYASPP